MYVCVYNRGGVRDNCPYRYNAKICNNTVYKISYTDCVIYLISIKLKSN